MAAEIMTFGAGGFPGVNRSFEHLERCTGMTSHYRLASNDTDGPELEFYCAFIRKKRPPLVLFGGWCSLYEEMMRRLRRSPVRFGLWWLSTAGQTDMSSEVERFSTALFHPRMRCYGFAQRSLAESLKHTVNGATWLPVPMHTAGLQPPPQRRGGPTVLSLFCSPHEYRRKNVLNTLLAVASLKDDYLLYLNGLSRDPSYLRFLRKLEIRYHDWGWMSDADYHDRLNSVDLGLQLSFTESFNQVSAEHMARSVPVLASPLLPAMDVVEGADRARLIVEPFENPEAIAARLSWLIRHPAARMQIGRRCAAGVRKLMKKHNAIARSVLRKWINTE